MTTTVDPQRFAAGQALRQRVFGAEYQVGPAQDIDEFDAHCDHLLITHRPSRSVVGTCRLLRPEQARNAGGHYSDRLFDLSPLQDLFPSMLEMGRLTVHPDHRNGAVVSLLWMEVFRSARVSGCRWLAGSLSIPLRDGGHQAAGTWRYILDRALLLTDRPIRPRIGWIPVEPGAPSLPPLLRGYFRLGAQVGGAPAHDAEFGSADFLVLLDLERADQRYVERFTRLIGGGE